MSETKRKIVTIGGGTGTFVVLSGLKHVPNLRLTAIVSVLDDGGSTGRLRDAYGFLPPGDARQALVALADDDELIRKLFSYRFTKGDVAGHNLGNLLLTGLSDILGSGADAIAAASKTLRIKGTVLPVSVSPATLVAELEDGSILVGEHSIDERNPNR
ncbi:YvcK family protein, partial [Patescibacteria group bacterium]|nr:YvcK family protein [Patescibacteria group bacterium]